MDESKNRIPSTAGWVNQSKLPTGPNGRALCRKCNQEVPQGRRTFCGDKCVDVWKLDHNPALQRKMVFKRDKGVCKVCNTDTEKLRKRWTHLTGHWFEFVPDMSDRPYPSFQGWKEDPKTLNDRLEAHRKLSSAWEAEKTSRIMENKKIRDRDAAEAELLGFTTSHLWEMDHIVEVVMGGGGGFNADNCQTLCIPCHRKKTALLARYRAALRKFSKFLINFTA